MKNSNDTIGNRTRDLPACSAVPQPTAPPRAPKVIWFRKCMDYWRRVQGLSHRDGRGDCSDLSQYLRPLDRSVNIFAATNHLRIYLNQTFVTLMMEAARNSETSMQTHYHTRYKDPEGIRLRDNAIFFKILAHPVFEM